MNEISKLVEQHVLASQAHLTRIDEMMAKASQAKAQLQAQPEVAAQLGQIQQERDRLAKELEDIRHFPSGSSTEAIQRGEGLSGLLAAIGTQLERALTAIFEKDPHAPI